MTAPTSLTSSDGHLLERVRHSLAEAGLAPTPAGVATALRSTGTALGNEHVLEITQRLRSEISGAGVLDDLLRAPDVSDVLVNGPDNVWVDRGLGLERAPVTFADESDVRALAVRLATAAGRRLDDAMPFVDARLTDGVRFHAVIPPIATDGTVISLRVPSRRHLSLDDLVAVGSIPPDIHELVQAVVRARVAFLVTGGTGSGKTTVLGALLGVVPDTERIVVVEDSSELRPRHPHVVRLEGRVSNIEGSGTVDLRALLRQALRMRPDRLVVGEVRGPEVADLLAALNTGHEGGCGTLHANSAADVPARLEALGATAGLGRTAVQAQATSALDVIIHLTRGRHGRRRLAEIHVVSRCPGDPGAASGLATEPAVSVAGDGTVTHGPGRPALNQLLASRSQAL